MNRKTSALSVCVAMLAAPVMVNAADNLGSYSSDMGYLVEKNGQTNQAIVETIEQIENSGETRHQDSVGNLNGAPAATNPAKEACEGSGSQWNGATQTCSQDLAQTCKDLGGTWKNGQCSAASGSSGTAPAPPPPTTNTITKTHSEYQISTIVLQTAKNKVVSQCKTSYGSGAEITKWPVEEVARGRTNMPIGVTEHHATATGVCTY